MQMKGFYFDGLGKKIQGKAGYWAVYATFYKALIMQKADPTQQSSNRHYYIVWGFLSLPALDDQLQNFLLLGVGGVERGPHSEPLLNEKPELGSLEEFVLT